MKRAPEAESLLLDAILLIALACIGTAVYLSLGTAAALLYSGLVLLLLLATVHAKNPEQGHN